MIDASILILLLPGNLDPNEREKGREGRYIVMEEIQLAPTRELQCMYLY
jgi:hypothetical protein